MIISILNAIAAVPSLVNALEGVCSTITLWFIQRQNNETLSKIVDAASASAAATDTASRLAATDLWVAALSKPRVSSN